MKSITLFLLIILSVFSTTAIAGDGVGNGGDSIASEFILTAKDALRILKGKSEVKKYLDVDKFEIAILNTKISSTDDSLILNDIEVDAINYPEQKRIKINRSRWLDLRSSSRTVSRFNLVMHEYLGIMKIEDNQYSLSQLIVGIMGPGNYSTSKFWNPMNPTNNLDVHVYSGGSTCSRTGGIEFDLNKPNEHYRGETCNSNRKIEVIKTQGTGGSSNGIIGTYHLFEIKILNEKNEILGTVKYIPEWGRCLISESKYCSQSGSILIDNVSLNFTFLQN